MFVASYQVRVYFFHFLGDESELRDAVWVKLLLVAEGNRRSEWIASLAWLIGLTLFLNRFEETTVPSFPLFPVMTPTPPGTAIPDIPATKVEVCVPTVPMRIRLESVVAPTLPSSMLLLPVVRLVPALMPKAMLLEPVVALNREL